MKKEYLLEAFIAGMIWVVCLSPLAATLVWNPSHNAKGYSVEAGTNPGSYRWQTITTNTSVRLSQPPPMPGVTGYYTVRAFSADSLTSPPTYELWMNFASGAIGTNYTQRGVLESTVERAQTLDGQWYTIRTNPPMHFTNTSQCFYRVRLKINLY